MNPTDDDIRLALLERARDAATAQDVLPSLQPGGTSHAPRRARSAVTLASAVAAVAAVAAAALLVARSERSRHDARTTPSSTAVPSTTTHPGPAPRAFDPRYYYFTMAPIPGWSTSQSFASTDDESMAVKYAGPPRVLKTNDFDASGGLVQLWSAEGSVKRKPSRPANATSVTVNGRPGFYGLVKSGSLIQPVLVWQYAPNAWGEVSGSASGAINGRPVGISSQWALTVAQAVRPAERQVIRFPARFGYLPAGLFSWEVDPGSRSTALQPPLTSGAAPRPTLIGGRSQPVTLPQLTPVDPARLAASVTFESARQGLDVTVRGAAWPHQTGRPVVVNGRDGTWNASKHVLEVYGPDYTMRLSSVDLSPTPYSQAELTKVAENTQAAASFTDQSTWFDAQTALPR
jgi:hypothetical protein